MSLPQNEQTVEFSIPAHLAEREMETWDAADWKAYYAAGGAAMSAAGVGPLPDTSPPGVRRPPPMIWRADGSRATRSSSPMTARDSLAYARKLTARGYHVAGTRGAIQARRPVHRESGRRPVCAAKVVSVARVDDSGGGSDPPPSGDDPDPPKRRAALVAISITDRTCADLTGLEPRPWRLALVELAVPHARVGRRTICTAAAWAAAVERVSGAPTRAATAHTVGEIIELATRRGAR